MGMTLSPLLGMDTNDNNTSPTAGLAPHKDETQPTAAGFVTSTTECQWEGATTRVNGGRDGPTADMSNDMKEEGACNNENTWRGGVRATAANESGSGNEEGLAGDPK